jgi:hypothetical protein
MSVLITRLLMGLSLSGAPTAGDWSALPHGHLISIEMERVLYQKPNSNDFWVHFRVRNLTEREVGVQLDSRWKSFYPNQWGGSPTEHRGAVDERRMTVSPLTPAERTTLLGAFRDRKLVMIPPHGETDYFLPFDGPGDARASVDAENKASPFVLVVVDGQLRATDGNDVEQLTAGSDDVSREVALHTPVRWASLPEGARIPPK